MFSPVPTVADLFKFESGALTHTGRVRENNEDAILEAQKYGVWLVADGMGGHDGGEVASAFIVDHVGTMGRAGTASDQEARFMDRLNQANNAIRSYARRRRGAVMGSTVAALILFGDRYVCVWAGDSRIYRLRAGQLSQLSRDHSEVAELVARGILTPAEARTWPRRNVVTRAVGIDDEVNAERAEGPLMVNDVFLLCSDGLTAHVEDAEIASVLAAKAPQVACQELIRLALSRGGTDNVSVVAVRCAPVPTVDAPATGTIPPPSAADGGAR